MKLFLKLSHIGPIGPRHSFVLAPTAAILLAGFLEPVPGFTTQNLNLALLCILNEREGSRSIKLSFNVRKWPHIKFIVLELFLCYTKLSTFSLQIRNDV